MKKFAILAASAAALSASPAFAQSTDSVDLDVTANVAQECSIEVPVDVDFGDLTINQDPGPDALEITQGRTRVNQQLWVSCNYGANMAIAATPMINQDQDNDGPDAADFTDTIAFKMGFKNSTGDNNTFFNRMFFDTGLTPAGNGDNKSNADAFHDLATLEIILNTPGVRPLAGAYLGTATIDIGGV